MSITTTSMYRFLASILVFVVVIGSGNAQLSPSFYNATCPQFLTIVRSAVAAAVAQEARLAASLLRLHFHDCFVQGCDASVLLDDTANFTGEKTAFGNVGSLRGFEVIDTIKTQVERVCPGVVSCADILAVAARDSVVILQGPRWTVGLGRRDSLSANLTLANEDLVGPANNLSGLISGFARKGFTASEMVTLSGAHTIGLARCVSFRDRIYNETTIDRNYALSLRATCPRQDGNGDNNLAPFDVVSPANFDNDYYQSLINRLGLLHSDQQLMASVDTIRQVRRYVNNSSIFFNDFANAMVKMSIMSPLTGTQGQIRINCRRPNPSVTTKGEEGSKLEMPLQGKSASAWI